MHHNHHEKNGVLVIVGAPDTRVKGTNTRAQLGLGRPWGCVAVVGVRVGLGPSIASRVNESIGARQFLVAQGCAQGGGARK